MDNYSKAKERLKLWEADKIHLQSLVDDLELLELEYCMQGISYDGIGGGSGEPSDSTGDTAMRLADKRRKLEFAIAKETKEVNHLQSILTNTLTRVEYMIIIMFYPNRKSIKVIGKELKYSDSQIKRIKKEAMNKVIVGLYGRDK